MIESTVANVPIFIQIAFGAIAVVGVLLLLAALLRRFRNAVRHRLPQPFLGDGSNIEWAEQKRLEILVGQFSHEQQIESPSTERSDQGPGVDHGPHSPKISSDGIRGESEKTPRENPSGEVEAELIRAWIANTDHDDDGWAERVLGDYELSDET